MSKESVRCFECGESDYEEITLDRYPLSLPNGDSLFVPNITVLVCPICHDECIPPESSRQIDKHCASLRKK